MQSTDQAAVPSELTSQNNLEAVKRMKDAERQTRCYRQTHSLTGLHDSLIHIRYSSVTRTVCNSNCR